MVGIVRGGHWIVARGTLKALDPYLQVMLIVAGAAGSLNVLLALDVELVLESDHFRLIENHTRGPAEVARLFSVDQRPRRGLAMSVVA